MGDGGSVGAYVAAAEVRSQCNSDDSVVRLVPAAMREDRLTSKEEEIESTPR